MGETSVYYVPVDQHKWLGRADELAQQLWDHGVFLETPAIMGRLREYSEKKLKLPECTFEIDYAGMGVADETCGQPVPNMLYEIACPKCGVNVMESVYEVWGAESDTAPEERTIECPACSSVSATKNLQFVEPMEFARFYIYVSDCIQEEWDPNFRVLLEKFVGPCHEYWEWST